MNRLREVDDSSDDEQPQLATEQQSAVNDDQPASASESGEDAADSSEESDDDDEEEAARVREGFIVDSDSDEGSQSDNGERKRSKSHRRKRRRHKPEDEEQIQLDEDDLDLLGETRGGSRGESGGASSGGRFKRLKRATSGEPSTSRRGGLDAMFDDEEKNQDESEEELATSGRGGRDVGEFDDFIEADEFSEDDDEEARRQEEREIGRRSAASRKTKEMGGVGAGLSAAIGDLTGLDEEKLSEIYDVFGDGENYDWALANEEDDLADEAAYPPTGSRASGGRAGAGDEGEEEGEEAPELQLTDVFEPSELSARMLTTEDNAIRSEDIPERYQLLRQRLQQHSYELSETEFTEKKQWVADKILERKSVDPELVEATTTAVKQVVEFIARENLEVPFIWHHRQDYLVHFSSPSSEAVKTQLLTLDDLWRIVDFDLDFHAIVERRGAATKLTSAAFPEYDQNAEQDAEQNGSAGEHNTSGDSLSRVRHFLAQAKAGVEFQDIIDFIQFSASAQLRAARRHSRFSSFDRVRNGPTMELVTAFNLDPVAVYEHMLSDSPLKHEDMSLTPNEVQNELGASASVHDALNYAAHSLAFDPDLRKFFRSAFEQHAKVDLVLTDDGRRKITSNSSFADLKYSYNWTLSELREQPALFLRMLAAEAQGLLIIRAQYPSYKTTLYHQFESVLAGNSQGEWREGRQSIAKQVSRIVVPMVARNVLENLRMFSVRALRYEVRAAFAQRLDQAPYKPPGYVLGTVPRVMCISAGEASHMDAVLATVVDEDGYVSDVVKLGDAKRADFSNKLLQTVHDIRPDVIGVAGFTAAARRLFADVKKIVGDEAHNGENKVMAGPDDSRQPLAVVWVQDEVARLYRHSDRAVQEFPELVPNARYSVAVARYMQNPVLEYAQLEPEQLRNLLVHKYQSLLPEEEFDYATETAFVDAVCLEGVDINLAVRNQYFAAVLRFVGGLGPRKAAGIVQSVLARARAGRVALRTQLVTAEITSRIVFINCASFLRIPWSQSRDLMDEDGGDYLDATRIHPEDYELARKMCADALELDEEDIEAVEERTPGGVVGQLVSEDSEGSKLEELVLEEYAEELDQLFKQKKRITLGNIRSEIEDPYAEKRHPLHQLTADEVFTMLTGETRVSFHTGSVISGNVRRVTGRQLVLTLSGGVDGVAESGAISDDRSVPLGQQFAPGQTVQAVIENIDYLALYARINTKESAVQQANIAEQKHQNQLIRRDENHWNSRAERRDIDAVQRKAQEQQRQMRVIKHPLFRPFGAREAEAFLAPLQRGDLVIRPSSRGLDHLVVTWKVADQIYQHIDVLELDKPNDYALGKTLCVGNYRYHDLDELIIMHVQSMARKVDEMVSCEKFQQGNRRDVEKWLSAYTNARPTQSVYAFCFDHKRPGYFLLSYMLGANQPIKDLHVKVLPNGFEFMKSAFPNVQGVINGFKTMAQRMR